MAKRKRRIRWDVRDLTAYGAAGLIALLGYVIAVSIIPRLFFASVATDEAAGSVVSTYSGKCLFFVTCAAAAMIVAGFRLGTDHVAYNWGFVAGGVLILVLGLSWLFMEKVEYNRDAVTVRSWWGLYRLRLPTSELGALYEEHHYKAWRRHSHWRSLHYRLKDGTQGRLCRDVSAHPLWTGAYPYYLLYRRKHVQP